jgi:hypothetical protein
MSIHSVRTMTGMINLLGDICISTRTYYGIRYAVAPTGDLRWRSPVPADEVRGHDLFKVINAVAPRPSCPQGFPAWLASAIPSGADSLAGLLPGADGLSNDLESSEDCLRLNFVTPLRPQSARLPVIVQIHGGGELVYPFISSTSHFVSLTKKQDTRSVILKPRMGLGLSTSRKGVSYTCVSNIGLVRLGFWVATQSGRMVLRMLVSKTSVLL